MSEKITSFTQLRTWQNAREFAAVIYLITKNFPTSEKFGLTPQLRRASVSVAANIAEGFSRDGQQDKKRFYAMSKASLTEALSHAYIAKDLGFMKQTDLQLIVRKAADLSKMLNGMIKKAPGRNT